MNIIQNDILKHETSVTQYNTAYNQCGRRNHSLTTAALFTTYIGCDTSLTPLS